MILDFSRLTKDILAGLTTSFAAIALGAAFGVQSGRGAFAGMIAAGVIPIVTSILGGTRLQASGPTAPMTAVSVLLIGYAYDQMAYTGNPNGFVTLTILMMMVILVLSGVFRLGKLVTYIPNVVVLGFMNGIAVLIWWDQIKKLFGLSGVDALTGNQWQNIALALFTFTIILFFPLLLTKLQIPERLRPFIPGTLVTIIAMTYFFFYSQLNLQTVALGASVNSVQDFGNLVGSYFPTASLLTPEILLKALPFALQLSLLCYLDSLLTSLVIDKMTKETTDKNRELIAQGLANGLSGLLGGIPGAQATIRSVILLKEGAQTRLAGVFVGIFALLGVFVFKDVITLVASSIFVGVLFKAGLDVFEKDFFNDFFATKGWKNSDSIWQMAIVVFTTVTTVVFDLNLAVFLGTAMFYAAKYFLKVKDASQSEETSVLAEA